MSGPGPAAAFFGGRPLGDAAWSFELGRALHGAFDGAFGGAVAACAVASARPVRPDWTVASIDVRFLRGIPAGTVRATTNVLREGRSMVTISVDIDDAEERLSARATVGLVDRGALHTLDVEPVIDPPPTGRERRAWTAPDGVEIPILDSLAPAALGRVDSGGVATSLAVPWATGADRSGEDHAAAACLAADLCVGPPVAAALDRWVAHPNPDLALRFTGAPAGNEVIGVGRLERVVHGLATVGVNVWSGGELLAVGASTSMLLGG